MCKEKAQLFEREAKETNARRQRISAVCEEYHEFVKQYTLFCQEAGLQNLTKKARLV